MFAALTEQGVVARFLKSDDNSLVVWNLRDFAKDRNRTVDDRPYGGGPGMVLMAETLVAAIEAAREQSPDAKVVYTCPAGQIFDQGLAEQSADQLLQGTDLIFICGRYEGIDQRVIDHYVDELWSLGDFVLSGGEIAVMAMVDAIARHFPGCLGNKDSVLQDSFVAGLLDYGHYTRPENFAGYTVPEVLLSGDHQRIAQWREQQALRLTLIQRPDLLKRLDLTSEQVALLEKLEHERPGRREKRDE